jgi:hypothetical protein
MYLKESKSNLYPFRKALMVSFKIIKVGAGSWTIKMI